MSNRKRLSRWRRYDITYDNPMNRNYRLIEVRLSKYGHVAKIRHPKTTIEFCPFGSTNIGMIKKIVKESIDYNKGSAIIIDYYLGKRYRIDNRSNRKGVFLVKYFRKRMRF